MNGRIAMVGGLVGGALTLCALSLAYQGNRDALEKGFLHPPAPARPHVYYMLLNGYVDRAHAAKEIEEYARAGIGGLCIFDVGARGGRAAHPPAGPEFLSPQSASDLAYLIRAAGERNMEVDLSVSSSWDMGGTWVKPEDASMTLVQSSLTVEGGRQVDIALSFPAVPPEAPRGSGGLPAFHKDTAVIAIPDPRPLRTQEFVFELRPTVPKQVNRVVLYNNAVPEPGGATHFSKDFVVSVSVTSTRRAAFREVMRASLEARGGPQEFRFPTTEARYVRLEILNGYEPDGRVDLAEFEVFAANNEHVNPHWRVTQVQDPAGLLRFTSARGQAGDWSAENIHDGVKQGPRGSWSSGSSAALEVASSKSVVDLTDKLDAQGRLRWDAPAGRWLILRYVCVNTGERLKVPSPNSDGLATDHLNADATRRYLREAIRRLRSAIPDLKGSALRDLYLASYEVRGQIWTPAFLDEFRQRRGYDFTPFLPVLNGGTVDGEETTERVIFDYRKTLGELLVDAYYRAAVETAHEAGLNIESEAGGPGPYLHQVPVDALLAQGSIDSVRGEFWPDRMDYSTIWVVKETASAAHIYGKNLVHMEAFTSSNHWQEGPQDLKLAADRAFTEGMNHVVWHTSAHLPPMAGKPGWVYYAGTHLNRNVPWWPMAKPFLDYLARASFLLQTGVPVSDVLYYYGDQGYNFVRPKRADPRLGFGYEYDVVNANVLTRLLRVDGRRLTVPGGARYEILGLPEREDIDLNALQAVERLVRGGATVVGAKPERSSGYSGYPGRDAEVSGLASAMWGSCDGKTVKQVRYGSGIVACGLTPREALEQRGVGPDLQYQGTQADLDFIHRRAGEAEIYFVRNKKSRPAEVLAEFRVRGKQPELWDPATGASQMVSEFEFTKLGTKFRLRLDPEGSIFVIFRQAGNPKPIGSSTAVQPAEQAIPGPWRVKFVDGPAAPEPFTLTALRSWTESSNDKEKYFTGIAEYEAEFELPAEWRAQSGKVLLDLGDMWAIADVTVNGQNAGVVWKRPFRLDISSAAQHGRNRLVVRVANNWVNRLVGDARIPGPGVTRTNVTSTGIPAKPWARVDVRRSGLMGPVRLIHERR